MPFSTVPGLELAGPANEARHAPAAFPVGVLFRTERRDAGVRPGVVVHAVVGRVHDDGVVGDAKFVDLVQHHADVLVVRDHHVVVVALAALALVLFRAVSAEVHRRGVVPDEERRLPSAWASSMKLQSVLRRLVIDGFHALDGQSAGVLDRLSALAVGLAVQDAARAEPLLELRVLRVVRPLPVLPRHSGDTGCRRTRRNHASSAGARRDRRSGSCRTGR